MFFILLFEIQTREKQRWSY